MNDTIAKSMCTMGVWAAAASILIWADFSTPAPVELVVLAAAGFSTAAIWNYHGNIWEWTNTAGSKTLRSGNETADRADTKKHDA